MNLERAWRDRVAAVTEQALRTWQRRVDRDWERRDERRREREPWPVPPAWWPALTPRMWIQQVTREFYEQRAEDEEEDDGDAAEDSLSRELAEYLLSWWLRGQWPASWSARIVRVDLSPPYVRPTTWGWWWRWTVEGIEVFDRDLFWSGWTGLADPAGREDVMDRVPPDAYPSDWPAARKAGDEMVELVKFASTLPPLPDWVNLPDDASWDEVWQSAEKSEQSLDESMYARAQWPRVRRGAQRWLRGATFLELLPQVLVEAIRALAA